MIVGGYVDGHSSADVVIFNSVTTRLDMLEVPQAFKMGCLSKPALLDQGIIVALVYDNKNILKLVRIKMIAHHIELTVLHTIGHHKH